MDNTMGLLGGLLTPVAVLPNSRVGEKIIGRLRDGFPITAGVAENGEVDCTKFGPGGVTLRQEMARAALNLKVATRSDIHDTA
ncbi:MAG: hypothetical protein LQ343_005788 [Gyalolechia ehrenbergii]|nr:MAG: hypothetical protein LQ343_005788 [Gyalolechia ehrenbergii]